MQNRGQLKVSFEDKPLSKVYVKCFCYMKNGGHEFFKDGYTDLRGSFDYAGVNSFVKSNTINFKILICSEEYGSVIQEVEPPKKLVSNAGVELNLLSDKWVQKREEVVKNKMVGKKYYKKKVVSKESKENEEE